MPMLLIQPQVSKDYKVKAECYTDLSIGLGIDLLRKLLYTELSKYQCGTNKRLHYVIHWHFIVNKCFYD